MSVTFTPNSQKPLSGWLTWLKWKKTKTDCRSCFCSRKSLPIKEGREKKGYTFTIYHLTLKINEWVDHMFTQGLHDPYAIKVRVIMCMQFCVHFLFTYCMMVKWLGLLPHRNVAQLWRFWLCTCGFSLAHSHRPKIWPWDWKVTGHQLKVSVWLVVPLYMLALWKARD